MQGRLHPLTIALRDIADIFGRMGFSIAYGPEIEDDFHNFTGLNIPPNHPARGMQDTFWLKSSAEGGGLARPDAASGLGIKEPKDMVLRTHTTAVSIRELENLAKAGKTEARIICPGKAFRNEATDMSHEAQFYQVDGFAVGPKGTITLAHMKGVLEQFYREYLGPNAKIRFRPSFFGFTEPSVEVDIWFEAPGKEGRWLEHLGGGMFHPNVIRDAGLDPEKVAGFAFGGGLERLLMIKYGIPDVRLFHSGDVRFVHGFEQT